MHSGVLRAPSMNDLKGECGLLLLLMLMCGGNQVLCSRLWREVLWGAKQCGCKKKKAKSSRRRKNIIYTNVGVGVCAMGGAEEMSHHYDDHRGSLSGSYEII